MNDENNVLKEFVDDLMAAYREVMKEERNVEYWSYEPTIIKEQFDD